MKVEKYKDYFGKDASDLKRKKLFLFDMDGTIYNEGNLFEGTLDLLQAIKDNGGRYVFITNNSSKSVDDYIVKLKNMGIEAEEENFFTSTQATILLFKEKYPEALVYCQGTEAMNAELERAGITVTNDVDDKADVILVGFDTELTGEKIEKTCRMLQKNIPYYATNSDLVCPVSFGFIPDCGSICQMLYYASKRNPIYIGKPEPTMVEVVRKKFGYTLEDTVVIGDRLYTDIASGLNAGVSTVCVLTGEATVEDIKNSSTEPTYVFASVKEIFQMYEKI